MTDEINEEWIREFVLSKILYNDHKILQVYLSESDLLWEIITKRQLDMKDANAVFARMKNLGLELCIVRFPNSHNLDGFTADQIDHVGEYDLQKFAILRNWL